MRYSRSDDGATKRASIPCSRSFSPSLARRSVYSCSEIPVVSLIWLLRGSWGVRGRGGSTPKPRSAPRSYSGGTSVGQRSKTYGQRGWKRQPLGGRAGVGHLAGQRLGQGAGAVRARDRGDERLGVGMARRRPDRAGRALLDDLAQVHHEDGVGDVPDDRQVVGDQEQREVQIAGEPDQEVRDLRLRRGVERGERLVEHDHGRVGGEGAGDRDALALAAAELMREPARRRWPRAPPCRAAPQPVGAGRARSLSPASRSPSATWRADRPARVQRRVRVLEDHLQPGRALRSSAAPERRERRAVEDDLPGRRARRGRPRRERATTCRTPTRRPGRRSGPRSTERLALATARMSSPWRR